MTHPGAAPARPTFGPAALRVRFDATKSTDPDGDPLGASGAMAAGAVRR